MGQFRDDQPVSWLDVGKNGKDGTHGAARTIWLATLAAHDWRDADDLTGRVWLSQVRTEDVRAQLRSFCKRWPAATAATGTQNEHALESRILRGDCPVELTDGRVLQRLSPDLLVNWGSQFPTRWGITSGSAATSTPCCSTAPRPYAVEMKVENQSVGLHYRHAIAQAVLYRHFIRIATPLHPWFDGRGLRAEACEAVVVVPQPTLKSSEVGAAPPRPGRPV